MTYLHSNVTQYPGHLSPVWHAIAMCQHVIMFQVRSRSKRRSKPEAPAHALAIGILGESAVILGTWMSACVTRFHEASLGSASIWQISIKSGIKFQLSHSRLGHLVFEFRSKYSVRVRCVFTVWPWELRRGLATTLIVRNGASSVHSLLSNHMMGSWIRDYNFEITVS